MDANMLSLVVGIVSSLVATAIFLGLSKLWSNILLPWFTDKIYRGVRVDGRWTMISQMDQKVGVGKAGSFLDLDQKSEEVRGHYYHTDDTGDKTMYSVRGSLRNMHLVLSATPVSNRVVDAMVLLFHVRFRKGKLRLDGGVGFISQEKDVGFARVEFALGVEAN